MGRGPGMVPLPTLAAEAFLAPAAVGLALAAAAGMRAFEVDLPDYHFGWRQIVSAAALVALLLALVPPLGAAFDGRWKQPRDDVGTSLSWMNDEVEDGSFRVLWLGAHDALPVSSWHLQGEVSYGVSRDGTPDIADQRVPRPPGPTSLLASSIRAAMARRTTEVGRLLGPMAVRYVVVVKRPAPGTNLPARRVPPRLLDALGAQLDLRRIESDASFVVYENASWLAARASLPRAAAVPTGGLRAVSRADLTGSAPVLPGPPTGGAGPLPPDRPVLVSEAASSRWKLDVDGRSAPRETAFGWAMVFDVGDGGSGRLRLSPSILWIAIAVAQLAAWCAVLEALRRRGFAARRARRARLAAIPPTPTPAIPITEEAR